MMRVLVVDDDTDLLAYASIILERAGHDPATSSDPVNLPGGPFDVVVTDMMMPGRSGDEVVREVASRFPPPGLIVWTALPEEEARRIIDEVGVEGVAILSKPRSGDELLEAIEGVSRG